MLIDSRYLATVRRATWMPWPARISAILLSLIGRFVDSPSISFLIMERIAVAEHAPRPAGDAERRGEVARRIGAAHAAEVPHDDDGRDVLRLCRRNHAPGTRVQALDQLHRFLQRLRRYLEVAPQRVLVATAQGR